MLCIKKGWSIRILTGAAFSLKVTLPGRHPVVIYTHVHMHMHTNTRSVITLRNEFVIRQAVFLVRGCCFFPYCLGGDPWPSHCLCSAIFALTSRPPRHPVCMGSSQHVPFLFCSVSKLFHKDKYNFLGLLATILPLLIIPFRAATTWCASTGDGFCVDPTLLHNTSNATSSILDINQACITASSVQWIIASLAYMTNTIQVVRYLIPFRYMCILTVK